MEGRFDVEELTISDLQVLLVRGAETSQSLVAQSVERINAVNPALRAVLEINPQAEGEARRLDDERKAGMVRSPLHGIPILIKDNIDTADRMMTTAGSLALVGSKVLRDARLIELLRNAGVVLLGKTNMSEWANFRSAHSSSGWSARGGQCRNPYALDRSPSGSSSGSAAAVAANLAVAAVGTETDGSIISPSHACSVVGLKPTVGLVSRRGVIPLAPSQDTAGPIARSVKDVALLLTVLAGAEADDGATVPRAGRSRIDYAAQLRSRDFKGKRIGVVRSDATSPGAAQLLEDALVVLDELGAVLEDPVELPDVGRYRENDVLQYEFKDALNRYLQTSRSGSQIQSLRDLIQFNLENSDQELGLFGQDVMLAADAKGGIDEPRYLEALADNRRLARDGGIDGALAGRRLDALVAITGEPAWLIDPINGDPAIRGNWSISAIAGYPQVTVPAGYFRGLPVGLSFFGAAWSEVDLLNFAYAYESATRSRLPPQLLETAG